MTADEVLAEHGRLARNVAVFMWRKLGGAQRCPVELDDMKQEAAIALLAEAPLFNGEGDITGFLVNRLRLRLIDHVRSVTGYRTGRYAVIVDVRDPSELPDRGDPAAAGAFDELEDAEVLRAFLRGYFKKANPVHARMIALRLAGYTMAETARLTDRSESAVCLAEQAMHRAARQYGQRMAVAA